MGSRCRPDHVDAVVQMPTEAAPKRRELYRGSQPSGEVPGGRRTGAETEAERASGPNLGFSAKTD